MPEHYKRLGEVSDINGVRVHVGTEGGLLAIGRYRFNRAQAGQFARLFMAADRKAGQQDGIERSDGGDALENCGLGSRCVNGPGVHVCGG